MWSFQVCYCRCISDHPKVLKYQHFWLKSKPNTGHLWFKAYFENYLKNFTKFNFVLVNMVCPLKYCQNLHDTCGDIHCLQIYWQSPREEQIIDWGASWLVILMFPLLLSVDVFMEFDADHKSMHHIALGAKYMDFEVSMVWNTSTLGLAFAHPPKIWTFHHMEACAI